MKRSLILFSIIFILLTIFVDSSESKNPETLATFDDRYDCMIKKCCPNQRKCYEKCEMIKNSDKQFDCINICFDKMLKCSTKKCKWTDADSGKTFIGGDDHCEE